MKLRDFKVLSFDCYGTLIDWDSGIATALAPLLARAGVSLPREAALQAFARLESRQQALTPALPYAELLRAVHAQLAAAWGVAADGREDGAFAASVGRWPAFPDTVESLRYLKRQARLVVLSNVDRRSFAATRTRLDVAFDAVFTAEDVGSYKPDPRNFAYLLDRLAKTGIEKRSVLHVAQSLFHDHVPANAVGLASAWVDRRGDGSPGAASPVNGDVRTDYRFPSLAALAEAHRSGG